jgi:hypothetical protein
VAADSQLLVATLPLGAASLKHRRERVETVSLWQEVSKASPQPVRDYFWDINDEMVDDGLVYVHEAQPWLDKNHPLSKDVQTALFAGYAGARAPADWLRFCQAELIRQAYCHLTLLLARERAKSTTGVVEDDAAQAAAAHALFAWSSAEGRVAAYEPGQFVDRWRVAGTSDAETLMRAALHAAECRLLAAHE